MPDFSPNMLKTYKECPRKYFLKYVQQISAPQKSTPFEKGKKIHALANYYLRGDDIGKLEKVLTPEESQIWIRLKENEYFQKTYVNSEYNISCKIGNFWIGGRLDAIVKDDTGYYILDYKTGSVPKDPENDYQTMIYLLAANKLLKNPEHLTFIYIDLKNNINHKITLTNELENKYEKEIAKICTEIEKTSDYPKTNCKYCEYSKLC